MSVGRGGVLCEGFMSLKIFHTGLDDGLLLCHIA